MLSMHRLTTITYCMIHTFLHRQEGETKKEYYRRMAQARKERFGTEHRKGGEETPTDLLAFQEERLDNESKGKRAGKGEPKCEQKIRNRMAAQQSRERHRIYVQELQRKVRTYQQLIDKQGLLCKNCRKQLHSDVTESESGVGKGVKAEEVVIKEEMVEEYLNEQIIRIDNNGAITPFAIFFLLSIITVLALFTGQPQTETRLLTSYSPVIKDYQQPLKVSNFQNQLKFTEFLKSSGSSPSEPKCVRPDQQLSASKSVGSGWTKFGEYVCSSPQVLTNKCNANRKPQFLLLRTEQNGTQQLSSQSEQSYKLLSKGWQRVQISQCYLGEG